jgi:hypothetical protein
MQITFKLYASLTEFLPADKRTSNQMAWTVPERPPSPRSSSPSACR